MRNETESDLRSERGVAALLCRAWSARLEKIAEDQMYLADYAVIKDGAVKAFVEIRCRSCSSTTHKGVFFPIQKLLWAQNVRAALGLPYFYVLQFSGDGVISYSPIHTLELPRVSWVKRVKERATHPDGPVVEIDSSSLKVIARIQNAVD